MKKLLFAAALMVAMSFASCGNKTTDATDATDSVAADTTMVDSIAGDSIN